MDLSSKDDKMVLPREDDKTSTNASFAHPEASKHHVPKYEQVSHSGEHDDYTYDPHEADFGNGGGGGDYDYDDMDDNDDDYDDMEDNDNDDPAVAKPMPLERGKDGSFLTPLIGKISAKSGREKVPTALRKLQAEFAIHYAKTDRKRSKKHRTKDAFNRMLVSEAHAEVERMRKEGTICLTNTPEGRAKYLSDRAKWRRGREGPTRSRNTEQFGLENDSRRSEGSSDLRPDEEGQVEGQSSGQAQNSASC